ncbi:MAG: peptidylprolyl isomerase [Bacteroidia bacterium]|nr:peptidylprolyl isomerase [Bacteroidia bacterium]MDW8157377.1 peptidylprolyl isomerase [Bacteroidia bacterium]
MKTQILLVALFFFYLSLAFGQKGATEKVATIKTQLGDIHILLSNKTPKHKANFIKLVESKAYDSTLFHHVFKDTFLVAGDRLSIKEPSKVKLGEGASKETLEPEIVKDMYHFRGAVGAVQKPLYLNPNLLSDGAQFYIVTGKKVDEYTLLYRETQIKNNGRQRYAQEYFKKPENQWIYKINWDSLSKANPDTIRKINEKLFQDIDTKFQKEVPQFKYPDAIKKKYSEVGGAPHLDAESTIFGFVIGGMNVVEEIEKAAVDQDKRPQKPIRIITITLQDLSREEITKRFGYTFE